ncbi:MAG TPA: PDR/VanB family oxidoreductase [Stellaceae bacterium]|nr:PDR/VanB family oxidoreductase [Stellaceae bacterium]
MRQLEVVVAGLRNLTPTTRELLLVSADGGALPSYAPGAHILVTIGADQDAHERREYSLIGGAPEADDPDTTYRIAVQRKAESRGASQFLHERVGIGSRLVISPPENEFPLNRHPAGRLLIAGGIGIAPIYPMTRALLRQGTPFALHCFGEEPDRLPYRAEIERMMGGRAGFHYRREDSGALALEPLVASLRYPAEIYVCGPRSLIDATIAVGLDYGLSRQQIRHQYFDAAPPVVNTNTPFEVELRRSGLTVQVPPDASILETLITKGYHAKFYCGRGECGFCPLPVIAADGVIEHRDSYLSAQEKASGEQLCVCVSRLRGRRLVLDA